MIVGQEGTLLKRLLSYIAGKVKTPTNFLSYVELMVNRQGVASIELESVDLAVSANLERLYVMK